MWFRFPEPYRRVMSIKVRRTLAFTVGQGLLAAFVLWAAQLAPKKPLFSGLTSLFTGSFQGECINKVCSAHEVSELYTSYKSEMIDDNGSPSELARLASGSTSSSGPLAAMLESFLGLGYDVRARDLNLVSFTGIQARNGNSLWTFNGTQPFTGMVHQFNKPAGGPYAPALGVVQPPAPTSFQLGNTLMATYATGAQSNLLALRSAAPNTNIQSIMVSDNVTVSPIYIEANQLVLQGRWEGGGIPPTLLFYDLFNIADLLLNLPPDFLDRSFCLKVRIVSDTPHLLFHCALQLMPCAFNFVFRAVFHMDTLLESPDEDQHFAGRTRTDE
jgi:hypothetical protein